MDGCIGMDCCHAGRLEIPPIIDPTFPTSPAIRYTSAARSVVEELVSNGIQQILFDHDPELFQALTHANKQDLLRELEFEALKANFFYTRQRLQRGLGDAILCAENFAGEEPFLVALGDSILGLNAVSRAVSRMADVFDAKRASCVIAVEAVPAEETSNYGIVQPEAGSDDVFRVVNLVAEPGQ